MPQTTRRQCISFTDCSPTIQTRNPFGRSFGGFVYGGGFGWLFGGGHQSYPGNDIERFDPSNPRWDQLYDPEPYPPCCGNGFVGGVGGMISACTTANGCGGLCPCDGGAQINGGPTLTCSNQGVRCMCAAITGGPTTESSPLGRPYITHTYQQYDYDEGQNLIVYPSPLDGTWAFNPRDGHWTQVSCTVPAWTGLNSFLHQYDPTRGKPLEIVMGFASSSNPVGQQGGVFEMTWNAWTCQGGTNNGLSCSNNSAGDTFCGAGYCAPSATWNQNKIAPIGWPGNQGNIYGTYNPVSGKHIISHNTDQVAPYISTLDSVTLAWDKIFLPSGLTAGDSMSMAVNSAGVLVVVTGPANAQNAPPVRIYGYYPDGTFLQFTLAGPIPSGGSCGYANNLIYYPPTDKFYLQCVGGVNLPFSPVSTYELTIPGTQPPSPTPSNSPTRTNTPTATASPTATPACTTGTLRLVGPTRSLTTPVAAAAVVQSGDCVHIDAGVYPNGIATWPASADNLTIRGIGGRAKIEVQNGVMASGKAVWVVDGDNTTIENVELACGTSRSNNPFCSGKHDIDTGIAGIRLEAPGLTVRNSLLRDNDDGILGGPNAGFSGTSDIVIENTEFFRNGWGNGQSHNFYVNARNTSLRFVGNWSHGATVGHLLKSRAAHNEILNNRLMDETNWAGTDCNGNTPGQCASSVVVDLPCGGLSYVIGNVIQKGAATDSSQVIKYAAELGKRCTGASQINCGSDADCTGNGTCASVNCLTSTTAQELYAINNTLVNEFTSAVQFIRGYGQCAGGSNVSDSCIINSDCPGSTCNGGSPPLLWAKNDLFVGLGTPISWAAAGTVVQANNLQTSAPLLVSQATYDYHLDVGSPVINAGIAPGTDSHGFDLTPTEQYGYPGVMARPVVGTIDIGGLEHTGAATPLPTPTSSPTNTRTATPVPSPSPTAPAWCSGPGDLEAVYSVAASIDDADVQRSGGTYTALGSPAQRGAGFNLWSHSAVRQNSGSSPFLTRLILWRWNTATRPDGSPWPAGIQITGAWLRPYWQNGGGRPLLLDWHDWGPNPTPPTDTSWANASVLSSAPEWAATVASAGTGYPPVPVALANAATNVNLQGYSGVRGTLQDATPPAPGQVFQFGATSHDQQTSAGDRSTQFGICYRQGPTPSPTATFPTHTPTVTPTRTPTSTGGTVVACVASTGNDGRVQRTSTIYANLAAGTLVVNTNGVTIYPNRTQSGANFVAGTSLMRMDTTAVPAASVITGATLDLRMFSSANADSRTFICEFYDPSLWPIDAADWTRDAPTSNLALNVGIGSLTNGVVNQIPLDTALANANIARAGGATPYTALRCHISGGQPTGGNFAEAAAWDHASLVEPCLTIQYSLVLPTATPTATPTLTPTLTPTANIPQVSDVILHEVRPVP